MILCIGTTPAAQRVMVFRQLDVDAVNRAFTTVDGIAGKSVNVAKVLKALGESPMAVGFLGGPRGKEIHEELERRQIPSDFVWVEARTRQCITLIDDSIGSHTELVEESHAVKAENFEALLNIIRPLIPKAKAVVMSGTLAPGGSPDLYLECTKLAHAAGVLSVVDAQGPPLLKALAGHPGLIKPNRAELAATTDQHLTTDYDVLRAIRMIQAQGAQRVVVTAGSEPTLASDGTHTWKILSPRVQVQNPIGSGDAFTAAMVTRLLQGDDLGEACRWGCAAGAANAMTLMPGDLNKADVLALVSRVEITRILA